MIYVKRAYLIIIVLLFSALLISSIFKVSKGFVNGTDNYVLSKNTVVIDAGHGGIDSGTIGVDGTEEKGINLQIASELYDFLMVSGINAKLIRSTDSEFYPMGSDLSKSDLYNRLDYVNSVENSVLISIHQNHFSNSTAKGTQIWYSTNDDKSKVLADSVLNSVKLFLQPDNERENQESGSSYYILYKAKVPSIMIECGFMSNSEENSLLKSDLYQKKLSFSILSGICEEV